jgi:hypothetical protein
VGALSTGCGDDFLTSSPAERRATGEAATEERLLSFLTSAYQPLLFDSYADNNYNSLPLMSDFRSDDIYKGGSDAGDQLSLYHLSQFAATPTTTVAGLWKVCYSGLSRCNNVLSACGNTVDVPEEKVAQIRGEAFFLRAWYTYVLWTLYGNIPYFTGILEEPPFLVPQYSADETYGFIMEDLDRAGEEGVLPMRVPATDVGRASRAAALMLKARVVLYQKEESRYAEITQDMAAIITDGSYSLYSDFNKLWEDDAEFCDESIFETNQLPEGKTWDDGWVGYGTNLPAFIGPNELKDPDGIFKGGWGFAPVRQQAYDMYEAGDLRRDGSINAWPEGSYAPRFQNTGYFLRKYAPREGYNPPPGDVDLNYANNLRLFRYAETLLNYVELVKMHGQAEVLGVSADEKFAEVRRRAFGEGNAPALAATSENIKLERRREFLGEGIRFYDLVRWGDAATKLTETDSEHNSSRVFTDKKKYLPIPQSEIDKTKGSAFELTQNDY